MKIRINNNKYLSSCWYCDSIGEIFEVKEMNDDFYKTIKHNRIISKLHAEVVEDEKSCENCKFSRYVTGDKCPNRCVNGLENWQPIEPPKKVKHCKTCRFASDEKPCLRKGYCPSNGYCDWREVVPMRETADPSKIVSGREQRKWLEEKEFEEEQSCDNCGKWKDDNGCVSVNGKGECDWEPEIKQATGNTEDATHYQNGSCQPIEQMQATMTAEQFEGYLLGNVIKYALRCNHKGQKRSDVGKCSQYAKWLVQSVNGETIVPGGK